MTNSSLDEFYKNTFANQRM